MSIPRQAPSFFTRRQVMQAVGALAVSSIAREAFASAEWLSAQMQSAAHTGAAVRLPPAVISTTALEIPDGVTLVGTPGRTVLKLAGAGPLLYSAGAAKIAIEGVVFDAGAGAVPKGRGALDFADVRHLSIGGCVIRNSDARGVNLTRCGGRFAQNTVSRVRDAGYYSLDGLGVDIDGNCICECGDNGVQLWTSKAGAYEGSRIRNNKIANIRNMSGGDGPYGNGVSIWGSGSVRVEHNHIRHCAYTAVRNNAGHDVHVIGNDCAGFGEKAMYAEFGAKRSVFRDNKIDDAGAGIAVANADKGTDGAVIAGNTITNLRARHPDAEFGASMLWMTGILAEKNCEILGNKVSNGWIGVALGGWRENLRAADNQIVDVDYGVVFSTGESVGPGVITHNKIIGARKAAIAAMKGLTVLPGDAAEPGVAARYPRLTVQENDVT